ncbi:hypothetical protein DM01DRAFT_1215071 [Hesseltinella vesiculosa]|uniref:Uncharacterized protein n=1 Tax=Hesseltinella vesiculosa TaxID=101127 RepID=A0A1X2G3B8_9FUNG|nr:hypothetical protein DM01DRAFT_1215071 [Hesseltinella vesiculosa]
MDQLLRVSLDDPMSLQPRTRSVTQRQAFAVSLNEALDMFVSGHDHATTTLTTEIEELEEQKQAIQRQYLTSSGQSRVRAVKHQFSGSLEPANGLPLISFGAAMVGRDGVHLRGHTCGTNRSSSSPPSRAPEESPLSCVAHG